VGSVVVVTGAASGIGRATAAEFLRTGANVLGVDVNSQGMEELQTELGDDDRSRFSFATGNLAIAADVQAVFVRAAELGGCRTLINAAGIGVSLALDDHQESDWDRVIDVNVKGSFLCLQQAARQMRQAGGGVVVNIASVVGFIPSPMPEIAYDVSKGAVIQLTRSAALELSPADIRVNAVAPGPVPTNLYGTPFVESESSTIPLGRGTVADVVAPIMFLASDAARWVTGQTLIVDGGWSLS
jgi:dihydroanticapsin dehydrogenase